MADSEYLTVREALRIILSDFDVLSPEVVPLLDGLNRVLATPILAREDLPPFANSAMDGYAVRSVDVSSARLDKPVQLEVIGDIAAGIVSDTPVAAGTAARITTGAPLPQGADAVIPVEDTSEKWRGQHRPLPAASCTDSNPEGCGQRLLCPMAWRGRRFRLHCCKRRSASAIPRNWASSVFGLC